MTEKYDMSLLPARFVRQIKIDPVTGCWLYDGALTGDGYAQIRFEGRLRSWHRLIYTLLAGPIPDGLDLDHVVARGCRYRHCANPAHLEPVTERENTMRGEGPTAINAAKTHCPKGHPFDEANTRWYKGRRHCRACRRDRWHERQGGKGGIAMAERTHCPKGHEYTPENTYINPSNGGRVCRICTREAQRSYQERKRAKVA